MSNDDKREAREVAQAGQQEREEVRQVTTFAGTRVACLDPECRAEIRDTHDAVIKLVEQGKSFSAKLEAHHHTLYGNSQPGLVSDMQFVKMLRKLFWIGVAAGIPILLAGAGTAIVWLIVAMHAKP
jgi:hypothetical protein